ncbi:MAG: glycosyltransferase family 4 protein [Candidatus Levybacteria bacterium]|nr:glycosyltransferase family 4 protein [Candidatus Levybacteria bacterium]
MKIALIAPVEETVPPQKYGGIEWIVYELASGLSKKGHEVDLYASADSHRSSDYHVIPITPKSLRQHDTFSSDLTLREGAKWLAIAKAIEEVGKKNYDIIHNHVGWRLLTFSNTLTPPLLTTLHGPLTIPKENFIFSQKAHLPYISISNNQRRDLPELSYLKTIYNAVDTTLFPFKESPDKTSLLFFARMSPEKGVIEAVKSAIHVKKELLVASKVDEVNKGYYEEFKKISQDNPLVTDIGEIKVADRQAYFQNSKALLAPIAWEEPFGLMFIEAMSSGTPVIAYARGAAPEIIKDGETGYLVNFSDQDKRGDFVIKKSGFEGLCEAIEKLYGLSESEYKQMRKQARKHVEENFSAGLMVDNYEKAYQELLKKH